LFDSVVIFAKGASFVNRDFPDVTGKPCFAKHGQIARTSQHVIGLKPGTLERGAAGRIGPRARRSDG